MFANSLGILEAMARLGKKATIGNINKMNLHMTRGQVDRCLKNLMVEGYAEFEEVPYGRTGMKIWKTSDRCWTNMCIVANAICGEKEAAA